MFVHFLVGHLVEVLGERQARADGYGVAAGAVSDQVHLDAKDQPGRLADGFFVVGPKLPAEGEQRFGKRLADDFPADGGERGLPRGGVVGREPAGVVAGDAEVGRDDAHVAPPARSSAARTTASSGGAVPTVEDG